MRLMITENSQYTPFGRVPLQRLFTVSEIYFDTGEASGCEAFANLTDIGRLMRIQPGEAQGYRLFLTDPFLITELPTAFPEPYQITDWRAQKGEFFQAVRMEKHDGLIGELNYCGGDFQYHYILKFNGGG